MLNRRWEMWQKILVPLDGSDLAELALPYAEELAIAFNSEVVLVHVSESVESEYQHMHQLYIEDVAGQMKKGLKRVSPVVISGKPAEEILSYDEKNNIGLVVMTSYGSSGKTDWAAGGIATKVLHDSRVPLLLVKVAKPSRKAPPKRLLSRVLLPLDGSEAGEAAVVYVAELMSRLELEVILFGVIPTGQHVRSVGGLDFILYPEQQLEIFKKEASEYLNKVYRKLKRRKGEVKIELKVSDKAGDIAQEIIDYAQEKKVSLIAISSHGHSGIERWVFGSTANKVVQDSKTAVLVVRATKPKP
jgi:nucleotide-binding universal stress UspA family protein